MYRRLESENKQLFMDIESMEQEIRDNSNPIGDPARGLLWFGRLTKYIGLLIKVERETSGRLTNEVQFRLAGTKTGYALAIGTAFVLQ